MPMDRVSQDGDEMKSDATYARYHNEYVLTQRQFVMESDREDLVDLSTEDLVVATARWVLDQHDRWAKSYVTLKCLAVAQRVELLTECEFIPEQDGLELVRALGEERPRPVGTTDAVHPKRRQQQKRSFPVRNKGLRQIIRALSNRGEEFDLWIAGLLRIGSRIGWRPGEALNLCLEGRVLSAPAEKYSRPRGENRDRAEENGPSRERGLFERLEARIGERYPARVLGALRVWIDDAARWRMVYEGDGALLAAIRERIFRACEDEGAKPFSPYSVRHFAIASMKRSGRSREEIAAIVNHLSNATAGEYYGKARSGIRRARKIILADPARVAMVRNRARPYPKERFDHRPK